MNSIVNKILVIMAALWIGFTTYNYLASSEVT